ncbi:unnamed protein product [Calicophoron daubneyi]|uniref:Uncharacterized protein n=1 Tax=Calicophoron daubneyi TaxID=300641 RepID=A0AAV2TF09_CALDB
MKTLHLFVEAGCVTQSSDANGGLDLDEVVAKIDQQARLQFSLVQRFSIATDARGQANQGRRRATSLDLQYRLCGRDLYDRIGIRRVQLKFCTPK